MKKSKQSILLPTSIFLVAALLVPAAYAQDTALLETRAGDLEAADTIAPSAPSIALKTSAEPVSFSRALEPTQAIELTPAAFVQRSREYRIEASAAELERGVALYTTAPAAVVRVNPIAGPGSDAGLKTALDLDPALFVLVHEGVEYRSGSAMDTLATPAQLKSSGAPFVEGTAAFRIRRDLGDGVFELRAEGLGATVGTQFLINVFEPESSIELTLETDRPAYLHGQTLNVSAAIADGASVLRGAAFDGFVTSPAGRTFPVSFRPGAQGLHRASLVLDADESFAPGLWEVHVAADTRRGGEIVLRGARTAFAAALPTATFDGRVRLGKSDAAGLPAVVRFGVKVAAQGRYEVSALLYGTDASGELEPIGVAHRAEELAPGRHVVGLRFDRAAVEEAGLTAPFEIRGLKLVDQSRMGMLHQQARALVID